MVQIQRRMAELGRLRMGEKGPKDEPRRRTTWRMTSPSADLLASAAILYGGTPAPWESPAGQQWQLETTVDTLPVLLPPTWDENGEPSVPFSFYWEHWSGGGCLRRCDGETELISGEDCKCNPAKPLCKPTTRVRVMLPELSGFGVWRLETHGLNAAAELPGGLEILRLLASHKRFIEARLRIEQRVSKTPGKGTKHFVVPVLDLATTPAELLSGSSSSEDRVEAIAPPPTRPALRAPLRPLSQPALPEATAPSVEDIPPSAEWGESPPLPAAPAIPAPEDDLPEPPPPLVTAEWIQYFLPSESERGKFRMVRVYSDGSPPRCTCKGWHSSKSDPKTCVHVPQALALHIAGDAYEIAAGVTIEGG